MKKIALVCAALFVTVNVSAAKLDVKGVVKDALDLKSQKKSNTPLSWVDSNNELVGLYYPTDKIDRPMIQPNHPTSRPSRWAVVMKMQTGELIPVYLDPNPMSSTPGYPRGLSFSNGAAYYRDPNCVGDPVGLGAVYDDPAFKITAGVYLDKNGSFRLTTTAQKPLEMIIFSFTTPDSAACFNQRFTGNVYPVCGDFHANNSCTPASWVLNFTPPFFLQ